jgi:hypothetical protein
VSRSFENGRSAFLLVALILLLPLVAVVWFVPLATCRLCGGMGDNPFGEYRGRWYYLPCQRCCQEGFIDSGRKVPLAANWFPKTYPKRTIGELQSLLEQDPVAPNGRVRYMGGR